MPGMNIAIAAAGEGPTPEMDHMLRKKAVDMYRAGVPMSVICTTTGIDEPRLNVLLDSVDLTPEELAMRDRLLVSYTKNTHAQIMARQARRAAVENEVLCDIEDKFRSTMQKGFSHIQDFLNNTEVETFQHAMRLMGIMKQSQEIWNNMNNSLANRDAATMLKLMKQYELERTETLTQLNAPTEMVQLDEKGSRVVKETSASRVITMKLKPKSKHE